MHLLSRVRLKVKIHDIEEPGRTNDEVEWGMGKTWRS